MTIGFIYIIAVFTYSLAALVLSFWQYDKALKKVYVNDIALWQQVGKPLGYFWSPEKGLALRLSSSFARIDFLNKSSITQLDYIKHDVHLHHVFRKHATFALLLFWISIGLLFTYSVIKEAW